MARIVAFADRTGQHGGPMWTEDEIRAGATYLLDDYSIIHVLDVGENRVRYRVRTRWRWRTTRVRHARTARLMRHVRAEIDGGFFPEVARPGTSHFNRPAQEVAALAAELARRAPDRPFGRR